MRILVVDDEFTARKLVQIYLQDLGETFAAANGKEAVEAYEQSLDEDKRYDLITLDIMMPEMDGVQALRKIRQIEQERGITGLDGVKVIMTTAKGQSEDIFGAFNSGCEAYIVKPVKQEKLFEEIEKLGLIKNQKSSS